MVDQGLAPQLLLEAAIATAQGWDFQQSQSDPTTLNQLLYIQVNGRTPPLTVHPITKKDQSLEALAREALQNLTTLLEHYHTAHHGYLSRLRPREPNRFTGEYDGLARAREWASIVMRDEDKGWV